MKRRVIGILMAVFALSFLMFGCNTLPNPEENPNPDIGDIAEDRIHYLRTYYADKGGHLVFKNSEGNDVISFSANAADAKYMPVEAVPYEGYKFIGWSDGVQTAVRYEANLTSDFVVTAKFEYIYSRYILNYRGGECDEGIKEVTFYGDDFKQIKFPTPQKEHFDFDGWFIGSKRVTDSSGNMVIGGEVINEYGNEIRAKYRAKQTFTYKLLLIYVTDIEASLRSIEDNKQFVSVNYTLSEDEKELCKLITVKLEQLLDYMFDGLVDFQVDEYFTQNKIVSDDFANIGYYSRLFPYMIPELFDNNLLNGYDSTLTACSLGVNEGKVVNFAGSAVEKYGQVLLYRHLLDMLRDRGYSPRDVVQAYKTNDGESLPVSFKHDLANVLKTFVHELTHTIELKMSDVFEYHTAFYTSIYHEPYEPINGWMRMPGIRVTRDYLLCEINNDGNRVGIPYEFWRGDKIVKITYRDGVGGYVVSVDEINDLGRNDLTVKMLRECKATVRAKPYPNYKFVGWSDGVTTEVRTDIRTEDYEVTALFERI